jgi:hypothetical protein
MTIRQTTGKAAAIICALSLSLPAQAEEARSRDNKANRAQGQLAQTCGSLAQQALPQQPRAKQPRPFTLTLGIGAQYDSNISVDDGDLNVRKGDESLLLSVAASFTPLATRKTTFRFGYSYDDARNRDLSDFDLAVHSASASLSRRIGTLTASVDYQYSHVLLGEHAYLDMHLASPALSAFATPHVFVRAAVTYLRKDFMTADQLDANTTMVGIDAYRLFARRKGYVAIGFRADDEWTTGPEFRYGAWQASARTQIPVKIGKFETKARLGYTYQRRDYSEITLAIGEKRHEQRSTFSASFDVPVRPGVTFRPQARFIDRHSNVALYDYRQQLFSATLLWKI